MTILYWASVLVTTRWKSGSIDWRIEFNVAVISGRFYGWLMSRPADSDRVRFRSFPTHPFLEDSTAGCSQINSKRWRVDKRYHCVGGEYQATIPQGVKKQIRFNENGKGFWSKCSRWRHRPFSNVGQCCTKKRFGKSFATHKLWVTNLKWETSEKFSFIRNFFDQKRVEELIFCPCASGHDGHRN